MKKSRGKILVIRGGAIGDFILTTPALRALRSQFPEASVELLGYTHIAQLALSSGLVDDVRSIEARPLASFFARRGKLAPELAEYFESFALILSYLYDPDRIFQDNIKIVAPAAQFIVGPHRPDELGSIHATQFFLKPLEKLAIFDAEPAPRLEIPCQPIHELSPGAWLAIHPGSGSETKNWALAHWVSLIEKFLVETNVNLLIVGGEADGPRLEAFAAYAETKRVKLLERRPLSEVAQALQGATAFVGHDSGITHLAAAVGLPVLALWGPTNADVWRPFSLQAKVLRKPGGLAALEVQEVWNELRPLVAV